MHVRFGERGVETYGRKAGRRQAPILHLPMDREEAQLLFQVIAASYERRSLIITTNLEFSKWGGIFTDDQMAAAMIDRLAHHGQLIVFEGESYRLKHALMRQK